MNCSSHLHSFPANLLTFSRSVHYLCYFCYIICCQELSKIVQSRNAVLAQQYQTLDMWVQSRIWTKYKITRGISYVHRLYISGQLFDVFQIRRSRWRPSTVPSFATWRPSWSARASTARSPSAGTRCKTGSGFTETRLKRWWTILGYHFTFLIGPFPSSFSTLFSSLQYSWL